MDTPSKKTQRNLHMDIALSAVASELVSRFVSFLFSKYRNQPCLKKNLGTLQHRLLRVHTVVEEAGGRYITNSGMLMQLKILTDAMYRGYDVLDTYKTLEKIKEEEVSGSYTLQAFPTVEHLHMTNRASASREVKSALENLEFTIANMAEFVALLTGCERMFRSPYSSYLYVDNFMFGRQVERQQVINILMQDNPVRVPAVLPIIGGCRVGKKTLVGSVCTDDRIRSCFSSIFHLKGDEIQRIDHDRFTPVRTLLVVEFQSDVDDKEWLKFYSLISLTGKGSKVIIISRLEKLARFGTVNPIRISSFSREEYSYLFKVLAFGSSNPVDHPRLALVGKELATMMEGSLVHVNVYTSVLRNNLNVQFWVRVLKLYKTVMEDNLSLFGERPRTLLEKGGAVDITEFSCSSSATTLRFTLLIGESDSSEGELPKMTFGDIIAGSVILPVKFQLVWESRLPPYTVISATCAAGKPQGATTSPWKKRRRLSM